MKKVAVTGGIASGKSTVCRFLTEVGAYVVSADEIVHHLLSSDLSVCQKVVSLLGPSVLVQGQLDRKAIAKKVFSHKETRKSLESILHPLVFYELALRYNTVKDDPRYSLFVVEIPLLYETNNEGLFDCVVAVVADQKTCQERFVHAHKQTAEDFFYRSCAQIAPEEKAKKAHFVLYNNGSIEELQLAVIKLAKTLCQNQRN